MGPSSPRQLWNKLCQGSPQTLGLFRIGLGVYLLYDLILRWSERHLLYSNEMLQASSLQDWNLSFFRATSNIQTQPWLWLALGVSYLLFAIGYRTRLFHTLSLIGFCSLVNYQIRGTYEGDPIIGSLLLWSWFVPLDGAFSLTAVKAASSSLRIHSAGLAVLKLQVIVIYLVSGLWKLTNPDGDWFQGTALYYGSRYACTDWGLYHWIQVLPLWITRILTWYCFLVWISAPFRLFFGMNTAVQRRKTVIHLWIVHAILCLALYPGDMLAVMVIALLPFLYLGDFSDRLRKIPAPARSLAVPVPGGKYLLASLVAIHSLSLLQGYETQILQPPNAVASVYYAVKPIPLINLYNSVFPVPYWRFHSFTPRYDTTFGFEGITADGTSLDLMPAIRRDADWWLMTFPKKWNGLEPQTSRPYNRLIYNFLWYIKKGGTPTDHRELMDWLKWRYENRYIGLKISEIRWHAILEITPPPGQAPAGPPTRQIVYSWNYDGKSHP